MIYRDDFHQGKTDVKSPRRCTLVSIGGIIRSMGLLTDLGITNMPNSCNMLKSTGGKNNDKPVFFLTMIIADK